MHQRHELEAAAFVLRHKQLEDDNEQLELENCEESERGRVEAATLEIGNTEKRLEFLIDCENREFSRQEELAKPKSRVLERRLDSAAQVKLDGKFSLYTRRPCTSSALLLPIRSTTAPLRNTEEEYKEYRVLTLSDGQLASIKAIPADVAKGKNDKRLHIRPKTSAIGQYTDAVHQREATVRANLFGSLVSHNTVDELMDQQEQLKGRSIIKLRREKIDLINGRRSKFVSRSLVPPTIHQSSISTIIQNSKARLEQEEQTVAQRSSGFVYFVCFSSRIFIHSC
jgi:hypothetical protein